MSAGDMVSIRVLVSVAGLDFSWLPGQVIRLPRAEAEKWADGVRAEYVAVAAPPLTATRQEAPETTADNRPTEKAARPRRPRRMGD